LYAAKIAAWSFFIVVAAITSRLPGVLREASSLVALLTVRDLQVLQNRNIEANGDFLQYFGH